MATAITEATERNVYLLQITLDRVCKAACRITNRSDGQTVNLDGIEADIAILAKALTSR